MHRLFDEQTAAGTTALPLIEEQAKFGTRNSRIQICIREDNIGALTSELEGQSLQRLGCIGHDDLSRTVLAGESDLVHTGMLY